MMRRLRRSAATSRLLAVLLALGGLAGVGAWAQEAPPEESVAETRYALARAQAEGAAAQARAERLEADASRVTAAADRTAREAAAVAARVQQTEAEIAIQEARGDLIARERTALRSRLALRQAPLVRLTAALQRLSRRPPVLALFRPGSMRDTVYMRALLATMLPEVQRRTADLRGELARSRALQGEALSAARQLREGEIQLSARRRTLAALETRQRLDSRAATGVADRETERALALGEEARDLGALAEQLRQAGALRDRLAALAGPVFRPPQPHSAQVAALVEASPEPTGLGGYILPVAGRLVSGFGDASRNGPRVRGIALATRAAAQVVAPAAGRVAFAGPYRGYGEIVIIEHAGGWTTLITGLARLDTQVGADLLAGSPLGVVGAGTPVVTLELRREGAPVNPLDFTQRP